MIEITNWEGQPLPDSTSSLPCFKTDLSTAMASMVETEAAMARWEMKEETLQNTSPNTQSLRGGQLQIIQNI